MVEFHSVGHKTKLTREQMEALLGKKPSDTPRMTRRQQMIMLLNKKESNNG